MVAEIERLYFMLKPEYSANDRARTINDILLQKGISKDALGQAWDEWFMKHGRNKNDNQ